ALDEVQRRNIRHVVLLGDYTDDGQRQATDRLAQMLRDHQRRFGTRFYAIPGNHDVFGPLGKHNSTRFVTGPDTSVLVTSAPKIAATEPGRAVLTPRMYCDGMPAGLLAMAEFGLFRQPEYLHWETPFGLSDRIEHRHYDAVSVSGRVTHCLMDASYLVEPAPDLWLLMIDANVFEPRDEQPDPARKHAFLDSANAGWNAVLRVKPFLMGWIADVCTRADRLGKHLLICSHYPVVDPFDDQTGSESALFTQTGVLRRTPAPAVADALIRAGVRHHFSGHVHANSITRRTNDMGQLTNIAVPSPVAFPPGFVVAHAKGMHPGIETVSLAGLPLDPALLAVYRAEAEA
ncbi:MAG: metallophosphoesterase, partial [Paracoccaceae bacterium]|nr:metallophosphoesterase [Paracoccaceae bacterium]